MDAEVRDRYRAELTPPRRGWRLFVFFLALHILLIVGPLLVFAVMDFFAPPKVNMFRVKIGARELSHGPEVGPPERTRPQPSGAQKPAQPTPKPNEKPKPKQVEKPKPKKVTKPKPTVTPKPKPKKVAKTKPKPKTPAKTQPTPKSNRITRPKNVKEAESQVYRPASGNNFNPNVPIGSRNRAQEYGKQDNRTPGGGATEEDEVFGRKIGDYLKYRWTQPPRIKLGDALPSTLIELEIASDGRVTGKRIVTPSGNAAMDASVQTMLDQLDRVPAPPQGKTMLQISMETK